MGYVTRDVPIDHPDFGRAFPCVCQRDVLAARRTARLRSLSNLDVVADKTFETFIIDRPHLDERQLSILRSSYELAVNFAQEPEGWLLFQGNYGSGKTHLAVAIANYRLELGEPVLFMTAPDLLDHLRATFGPETPIEYDELFERIRTTPLLILDDLGAESPTAWAQEKLYQLINHRYLHRLPTVFTTNSDLNRIDPRIRSRLVDKSLTRSITMPLPDFRRPDVGLEPSILTNMQLYGEMTFDTFDLREGVLPEHERRNLRQAFELALSFAETPQNWIVFMGEHGCGKTHLAAAIANFRTRMNENVVFVATPDLLDYLRAAYNRSSESSFERRFYEIRTAPLLIIDQFDLTNATPWALEKMRQIINYRYLANLPTVFTTNQTLEEMDPMVRSRLSDGRRCLIFAMLAPDYQGGKPPAQRPGRSR